MFSVDGYREINVGHVRCHHRDGNDDLGAITKREALLGKSASLFVAVAGAGLEPATPAL